MRTRTRCLSAAMWLLILPAAPTSAQTWAGNTSGNWSVGSNWSPAGVPVSNANTSLVFGATANASMTNDVAGTFVLDQMTFNPGSPTYVLTGNPLEFRNKTDGSGATPLILINSNSAVTIGNSLTLTNNLSIVFANSLALNGPISGAGSLTCTGGGTLTLGNASNSYAGGTVVNGGTVILSSGTAIPTGGNVTVAASATFNTGGLSNTAASAVGTVTLNGGTFRAPSGNGDYYLNQLAMTGGTVDFTGTSNFWMHFTGAGAGITVNAGTSTWTGVPASRIQNDTANPLTITVNGGTLNAGIILSSGVAGTSNPNFVLAGGGSMRLSNTANTANITATAGYLSSNDLSTNTGSGAFGTLGNGTITLSGGTLVYDGATASSAKPLMLGAGGGAVQVFNAGTSLTLTGVIGSTGSGTLTVFGSGNSASPSVLTLAANNSYSGPTSVTNQAVVAIPTIGIVGIAGPANPLGTSPFTSSNLLLGTAGLGRGDLLLTGTNATYVTDRGATVSGLYANGSGGAIGVQNANTNLTMTGQIIGAGSFIKTGAGTLTLTSANVYAGGTYVEAGRLALGVGVAVPTGGNVTVLAGAEFNTGGLGNSSATPIGTITASGGSLRVPSGGNDYYLNQWTTDSAGGTIDMTGSSSALLRFANSGAAITVNGNSNWIGPSSSGIFNGSTVLPITIAPGVTVTSSLSVAGGTTTFPFLVTGGGTLYLTSPVVRQATVHVTQARLRMDDLTGVSLGNFSLTLDNGTLQYGGPTASYASSFTLGQGGGTVEVLNAAALTVTSSIGGPGALTKAGPGVLTLGSAGNSFVSLTVNAGVVQTASDNTLGVGPVTVNPFGALTYTASAATTRSFTFNGGTLSVASGQTLTLQNTSLGGGFFAGPGTFATSTGGSTGFAGGTTTGSATLTLNGSDSLINFTQGGQLTVTANQTAALTRVTNTSSGRMTVNGTINLSDFVSNGVVAVNPGGVMNNAGGDLVLGGGSVTNVGLFNANNGQVTHGGTLSLGPTNLVVRGGLVRNNGTISSTTGNIVVDFGGVLRGSGTFDVNAVVLQNGGQRFSGNSPGLSANRNVDFVNTGTLASDMSNATGTPGSGNPNGFSGWGVYEYGATSTASGRATITGTPFGLPGPGPAAFKMATVTDAPPRDAPSAGLVANFNPAQAYTWVILRPGTAAGFNLSGGTNDPGQFANFMTVNTVAQIDIFDSALGQDVPLTNANLNAYLHFDASQWDFGNTPVGQQGTFGFTFQPDTFGTPNRIIALTYTPVPEPAACMGIGLISFVAVSAVFRQMRRRGSWAGSRGGEWLTVEGRSP